MEPRRASGGKRGLIPEGARKARSDLCQIGPTGSSRPLGEGINLLTEVRDMDYTDAIPFAF